MPPDPAPSADEAPLWKRLGWMVLIWVASVTVLTIVAYGIRFWLK